MLCLQLYPSAYSAPVNELFLETVEECVGMAFCLLELLVH